MQPTGNTTIHSRSIVGTIALAFMGLFSNDSVFSQIQSNSEFFSVRDYYYPDRKGDYRPYKVSGFAQPSAKGDQGMLHILPTISLSRANVQFLAPDGKQFDPGVHSEREVAAIRITPKAERTIPTREQIPAIAAVLGGTSIEYFKVPSLKQANNQPVIVTPSIVSSSPQPAVAADYGAYDQQLAKQEALLIRYQNHTVRQATLNQLSVSVIIDNAPVATITVAGSASEIPSVTLTDPT